MSRLRVLHSPAQPSPAFPADTRQSPGPPAVLASRLAASGAGAGVARATPGPTPDQGLTGACNMTNTNAAFGKFTIAGSVANANGFDGGMITAILNTNGAI